jgi:hypothetical protein
MLPDWMRQVLAGIAAAAVFLGLYLGARMVWPVALLLAALVLAAVLLLIRRKPLLSEQVVGDRVTALDLSQGLSILSDAQKRLLAASTKAPTLDRPALAAMAAHVGSIRTEIQRDPSDYRRAKRLTGFYLPQIVQTVEAYVDLSARATGDSAARVAELGKSIRDWAPVIEKIDQACQGNDVADLEAQIEALGFQMKTLV